jgi:hypothetical protein
MEKTNWLPGGYEVPKSGGNYLKFDEDTTKFRVMSQPVMGYEYWNGDNKPVRSKEPIKDVPEDARLDDGKFKPKHFWAFVVWNYKDTKLQILEITQATIQRAIQDLVMSEDWGDPRDFDLTVTGKGEGLERKYTVQPSPHKVVPEDAKHAVRETPINLEALFDGSDPFAAVEITKEDTPFQ